MEEYLKPKTLAIFVIWGLAYVFDGLANNQYLSCFKEINRAAEKGCDRLGWRLLGSADQSRNRTD